jgi:hypothetical protein
MNSLLKQPMLRAVLAILTLLAADLLQAEQPWWSGEYKGRMTVGTRFTQEDVRVTVDAKGNMTLWRVRFARLMPVKIDVTVPGVHVTETPSEATLKGQNIVPQTDGKAYPSRTVTDLHGTIRKRQLQVMMQFGDKSLQFSGEKRE